jgi:serine/threonine-protein kinase
MQVTLTVTAGPHLGLEFTFTGHDTFLVGRSKHAHFRLADKDKYFSRIHFLVEVNPPRCRLVDMGSRNGTHVNDQRVSAVELHDGDLIKAGHTFLRVGVQLPPDEPTAAAAPGPATATTITFFPKPGSGGAADDAPVQLGPAHAAAGTPHPPIPGYQLVRELGRGGMGVVFLAVRDADGSEVALKTIIPAVAANRAQVERFLREATILKQLDHPHIVAFREMGEANGMLYFAMDYVPGSDAGRLRKQHKRLPVRTAVRLICQALQGLEYAHAKGFVHRDIKPANLLVADEDGGKKVKLADFGLARLYQASQLSGLTLSGDVGGTTAFLPPEQITRYREAKPLADQYAAAATLYYLLTGKMVYDFAESSMQPLALILQEDPVPIAERGVELPDGLADVIHRALAREPKKRFPHVKAFRQALLPFGR